MYTIIYKQNTHGIVLQKISTGLELFWDDFPKNKIPTHFHSKLGFLEFVFFAKPVIGSPVNCVVDGSPHRTTDNNSTSSVLAIVQCVCGPAGLSWCRKFCEWLA